MICKGHTNLELHLKHSRHIIIGICFSLLCLYAKQVHSCAFKSSITRPLWQALRDYSQQLTSPWLVCGDFNTFRTLDDHRGRSHPSLSTLQDFNDCLEDCSLMDPPFHGSRYTWTDGRALGRVHR